MHPQAPSPALAAQSKVPRPKVLGSHFTFQAGGVGEGARGYPPPKLCQQEAMTHSNPKSHVLVQGGIVSS